MMVTEYFGRTAILFQNIFSNVLLTQNPSSQEQVFPFDLNFTKLPFKLKPHEEIVAFMRIADTKFYSLITSSRVVILDGATLRRVQEKKFSHSLSTVLNILNSSLVTLRFQNRYIILDLKNLSSPSELFTLG